jgi:predicted  nucleic acid-binding Zn-ribbon protein
MDPGVFLVPVGSILTIIAAIYVAAAKIIRLRATLREPPSADVTERLEALERSVQGLAQDLAETQERLDFTESLLSKAREERRIGG